MSEGPLFLIGIVVFAITVYGAVMAGGMALSRVVVAQEPDRQPPPDAIGHGAASDQQASRS